MTELLDAAWQGFVLAMSWPNILYPVAATAAAMVVALLPGISGAALMALAIPLTLAWEPVPVVLVFGALVGGATFMGSVSAILVNIPGSNPAAATLIDGYPMARAGQAKTALAASATASALGSTFGIVVLVAVLPFVRQLVPRLGPPEYLLLSVWGLVTIGTVIRGSAVKGLIMAGLGLMVSFIGLDPGTATPRFTLGFLALEDGLNVVPVFLGLFAIAEVIDLSLSGRATISGSTSHETLGGSTREGVLSVLRHRALLLRSSAIGTLVGVIPGLGGTAAAFIAYGDAARRAQSKGDSRFGEGDIRGVIAPEAAADAKDGASLLTTLAFGVPTGAASAVFLGALAIHGIRPGTELMGPGLPLTFAIIWSLFLSNWMTSVLGFASIRPLTRLTTIRVSRLVPAILVLATLGALAQQGRMADVWTAYVFGAIGHLLKKHGWPRIAFVMALVLGPLFEVNLRLTMSLEALDRIAFLARPTVLILLALITFTLFMSLRRVRSPRRREATHPDEQGKGESAAITGGLLLVALLFTVGTVLLSGPSRVVPGSVLAPLNLLCGYLLWTQLRSARTGAASGFERLDVKLVAWIVLLPALVDLIGLVPGAAILIAFWFRQRNRERALVALAAGVATALVLWLLTETILQGLPLGGRLMDVMRA